MKRVLRCLFVGMIAFSIGFGAAYVFNILMIKYLLIEGIEALNDAKKVEISNNTTQNDPNIAQNRTLSDINAREVTVCDLKNDPAKYNHSVVKVSGYFSRGFEDSTLYDPVCRSNQWIWVDLGGKRSINVMYCCNFTPKPTREEELEVEGIKLPITEDESFNRYDKLLAEGKKVKATVVGTFFSGKKVQYSKDAPAFYEGYGHMGIGSLFIVRQVLSSEVTSVENKLY